jgi:ubiquinone/menaquinone biosynthesis C-methylase UbiE
MNNKQPKAEFDQLAHSYVEDLEDPVRRFFADDSIYFHRRKLDLLLSTLRERSLDPAAMQWIDAGCGRGDLLKLGKEKFGAVSGCDISAQMLTYCEGITVRHQSAVTALPFPDCSADIATAVCLLHHVEFEDRLPLLQDLVRVLKPGGILAVVEHNPYNPVTRWIVNRSPVDRNARLLPARMASHLMENLGLHVGKTKYFLYLPENIYSRVGVVEKVLSRLPLGGQYMSIGVKPFPAGS